jgi:hypothetical protein
VLRLLFPSRAVGLMEFSGVSNKVQAIGVGGIAAPAGYTTNAPMNNAGPVLHLPGHAPQYNTLPAMHQQGKTSIQSMGYTAEHAAYPIIRHERIKEAYSTHNGEVVIVEVRLVIKLPGRVKAELVHVCA